MLSGAGGRALPFAGGGALTGGGHRRASVAEYTNITTVVSFCSKG